MSTLPQGGFGEHRGGWRRKPLIVGGVAIVLILVWTYAVLSYSGGDEASKKASPADSGAATARTTPSALPDEPAYAGGDTTADQLSTDGESDQPGRASEGAEADPRQESQVQDHPGGATNEPDSYDPLGTGASAGDLAPVDGKRIRFTAARFVSAAYGYSGKDKDAYNQGVGATVVWPDFFDSEGSSEITRYAAQVGDTGTSSAALLTRFEKLESSADSVKGYAYFETGSGYTTSGALQGKKEAYRQKMTLSRSGAVWKVLAVNDIEETR